MNAKLSAVLLAPFLTVGCGVTARLYPVQGPLMTQAPVPVYSGKISGLINAGSISFVLNNGETCQGRWNRIVLVKDPQGAQSAPVPVSPDMPAIWDQIYGAGYYTAHVLGTALHAQASITGSRGTVLMVEFYRANAAPQIYGVAKDSNGNIFKMTFSPIGAS